MLGRLAIVAVVIVGVDALPRPHYDSIDAIVGAENVGKLQGNCPNRCPGNRGRLTCEDSRCANCIACQPGQTASPSPPPAPTCRNRCSRANNPLPCSDWRCGACTHCVVSAEPPSAPPATPPASPSPNAPPASPIPNPVVVDPESPSPPPAAVSSSIGVRKSIAKMSVEEQLRYIKSVLQMQQEGPGKSFELISRLHGFSANANGEFSCVHGSKEFVSWHRVYLYEYEKLLQDAHQKLYGNRSINLPYWDWSNPGPPQEIFFRENREWVEKLSSAEQLSAMFPPDYAATMGMTDGNSDFKGYLKHGYYIWENKEVWNMVDFQSLVVDAHDFGRMMGTFKHDKAVRNLEQVHNSVHLLVGRPMSPLNQAPYHPFFWLHHCEIDRLYEAFLTTRELLDGNRDVVADEFKDGAKLLPPFVKSDGSAYVARDVIDMSPFGYMYDQIVLPNDYPVAKPAITQSSVLNRVANMSNTQMVRAATSQEVSSLSTTLTAKCLPEIGNVAVLCFGASGTKCSLSLEQQSFKMHFIVKKKNTKLSCGDKLPTHVDHLCKIPEYVGFVGHFGFDECDIPKHHDVSDKTNIEKYIVLPDGENVDDYEVIFLFEKQTCDGKLYEKPNWWIPTAACGGEAPCPSKDWITIKKYEPRPL